MKHTHRRFPSSPLAPPSHRKMRFQATASRGVTSCHLNSGPHPSLPLLFASTPPPLGRGLHSRFSGLGEGAEAGAPSRPESRGRRARTCCCGGPRPLALLSACGGWSGRCRAGPAGGGGRGQTSGRARGPQHSGVGTRWRRRSPRVRASRRHRARARASGLSRSLPRRSLRSSHRRLSSGAAGAVAAGTRRAWGCSPPSSCRCCRRPRTASWISKR